ncbi:MAG: CotH kinase family protein [Bacteroidetes bacterium]|nr:CotH kinase family protein [Bacteroidota bacterium]
MIVKTYFILFLVFIYYSGVSQEVVINEIVSLNSTTIQDDFGDPSDWIEIYNASTYPVIMNNWHLTDDLQDLQKWTFPDTTLAPGQFVLIFCSDRDTVSSYFHTNFKLKSSGEAIFLSDSQMAIIDSVTSIVLENDVSYGNVNDEPDEKALFYKTSPGYSNANNIRLNRVSFSHDAGFYETNIMLALEPSDTTGQIFYTINGNEPLPGSSYTFFYNGPISISEIQQKQCKYAFIPTTPDSNYYYFTWTPPASPVEKYAVIRTRIFAVDQPLCNIQANTYFVGDDMHNRFTMPVLSIITDSISLFDWDTGIYIPGKYHIPGILKSGNYWKRGDAWERSATIEYFKQDGELQFEKKLGIRIYGNITRTAPNKSLQLIAREEYDGEDEMNFPFFEAYSLADYHKVILRSSFAGHRQTIVRDEIMQEIALNLDVYHQEWQPVIVYLNGEYWGVQFLREKQDDNYLEQHFDIDHDSVDIVSAYGIVENGDLAEHENLIDFVENHDLSLDVNYQIIQEMIDIPAYIDYYITEIFVANRDWPGNNYTKWREKGEGNKWRWFLYDLDNGGVLLYLNNMGRATGEVLDEINPEWSTKMFKKITENETFKQQFLTRFEELLNTEFCPSKTKAIVNKWEEIIKYEAENTILRWNLLDSFDEWQERMEELRFFFDARPGIVKAHLEDYFGIDSLEINCEELNYNEEESFKIRIYPNPSSNTLFVIHPVEQVEKMELYTLSGQCILKKQTAKLPPYTLDISNLQKGLYILKVSTRLETYQLKVVKN